MLNASRVKVILAHTDEMLTKAEVLFKRKFEYLKTLAGITEF